MPKKILVVLLLVLFFPQPVHANISACEVTVSPNSLNTGVSDNFLIFSVTNRDESGNPVRWIKITSPSINFVPSSADGSYIEGHVIVDNETAVQISLTGLPSGVTGNYVVHGRTVDADSGAFGVQASDTTDGNNAATCTGNTGVAITSGGSSTINISNVGISITDTKANITWNTGVNATGQVNYGTTSGYGSTGSDANLSTSHSVSITGLTASTTYHYQVVSTDTSSNVAQLADNTFTTALAGVNTATTTTISTTTTSTVVKEVKDTAPPTLSLSTDFKKVYAQAPEIIGKASDAGGVNRVEYSLDGGDNWLPVDVLNKQYAKTAGFGFLPQSLLDGNYTVVVRAIDTAGNVGLSKKYTLIIDRLPPRVGLAMWSLGPIVLTPGADGSIVVVEGTSLSVVMSAVGGPTKIVLSIKNQVSSEEQSFELQKSEETGLWRTEVNFDQVGDWSIVTEAVDGADNRTTGQLGLVRVLPAGSMSHPGSVVVHFFEPVSGQWQVWDGAPFSQVNPRKVEPGGKFAWILPPGRYYLQAESAGFPSVRTQIFDLANITAVTHNFKFSPGVAWWPLAWQTREVVLAVPAIEMTQTSNLIGQSLPFFTLPSDSQESVYSSSLKGKPTVLTFLVSWSPLASEQMVQLEKVPAGKNFQATVVLVQQSASQAMIFKKRGGYNLPVLSDTDGELLKPLMIDSLPTHIFLDRQGKITNVTKGILNETELLNELSIMY